MRLILGNNSYCLWSAPKETSNYTLCKHFTFIKLFHSRSLSLSPINMRYLSMSVQIQMYALKRFNSILRNLDLGTGNTYVQQFNKRWEWNQSITLRLILALFCTNSVRFDLFRFYPSDIELRNLIQIKTHSLEFVHWKCIQEIEMMPIINLMRFNPIEFQKQECILNKVASVEFFCKPVSE